MHLNASKRFKEKDQELIIEIDKRDKVFHEYVNKAEERFSVQLAENTKAMQSVVQFLDKKNVR